MVLRKIYVVLLYAHKIDMIIGCLIFEIFKKRICLLFLFWCFCSMHYAKLGAAGYKGGLLVPPAKGDFCCAKFAQDDTWYRVQVVAVEESQTGTQL